MSENDVLLTQWKPGGCIPVHVSPYCPEGELWLIDLGVRAKIMCHEGPQAGQTVETWLREPKVLRRYTGSLAEAIADGLEGKLRMPKLPAQFILCEFEAKP